MKLTRKDLTTATKAQLACIGLRAVKGWLKGALAADYPPERVAEFRHRGKLRQLDMFLTTGATRRDFGRVRWNDGAAERFANALYAQCGRDLS